MLQYCLYFIDSKREEKENMKRFKGIVLAALAIFVVAGSIPVPSASAQSSALSIAPRKDYVIESGKGVEDTLTIRNLDRTNDLQLYLQVVDFTFTDDTGTPKLLLDTDAEPTPWSLRNYIKTPVTASVEANGSTTIPISIDMPKELGAGGYYSAIIYSTSAPSGGNLGLAASGVTLAFVNIPGPVNQDLKLQKLGAYNTQAKAYRYFNFEEPTTMGYTLLNNGNIFESPAGTINLKSMWGPEYNIQNINPNKSLALIGQERTFQACIKLAAQKLDFEGTRSEANGCVSPGLWPGLYTASIDLFYGQNGNLTKEITKTVHFWYLPLWFVILALIVIMGISFVIWRTVVMLRGGSFKIGGRPRQRRSSRRRR